MGCIPLIAKRIAAAIAVSVACVAAHGDDDGADASLLTQPYTWTDDSNRAVTLGEFHGRCVVFTMMYTTCRRTCSRTLAVLRTLQERFDAAGDEVAFVLVSLDTDRDSPDRLAAYRKQRKLDRENWYFLSGEEASVEALAHAIGVRHWRMDNHILHDFRILLLDTAGDLVDSISWQTDIDTLALKRCNGKGDR